MTESVAALRLTLNLQYKLAYVRICEAYLESEHTPEVVELLRTLILAQQAAIAPLSSYLRRQGVNLQGLEPKDKLIDHATRHTDVDSRMRFIHRRLQQAVFWYGTQLSDKRMTDDPELVQLLIEMGEIDAAKLWRAETVMSMLKIPIAPRDRNWDVDKPAEPQILDDWRPRLVEDTSASPWTDRLAPRWSQPSRRPPRKR